MYLKKNAQGKILVRLSKSEWTSIGKTAGWEEDSVNDGVSAACKSICGDINKRKYKFSRS